ncbi:hypothetical protein HU200_011057 [Digitaria exilis]|uniref:Transcription factor MYC/MYB N-terminal domain-containing protein n=1 Tax=Digitaria exilis TaxID=1010633 RepID=A0A835FH29_9POAL|nr:hypothetical protein HU200_011057 [Digitaria exilis]
MKHDADAMAPLLFGAPPMTTRAQAAPAAAAAYTAECAAGGRRPPPPPPSRPACTGALLKMSHDIYNYGEGLIRESGSRPHHKWVFQEAQQEHEINLISSWSNPAILTWEAQFQSGIKTIALIAVREGVVQLGSMKKVAEDLSYVVMLRRKFGYLESIPGVLLPHPSSAAFPAASGAGTPPPSAAAQQTQPAAGRRRRRRRDFVAPPMELYDPYYAQAAAAAQMHVVPSMSSLEALLSKLPSVDTGMAKEEADAVDRGECLGATLDVAAAAGAVARAPCRDGVVLRRRGGHQAQRGLLVLVRLRLRRRLKLHASAVHVSGQAAG